MVALNLQPRNSPRNGSIPARFSSGSCSPKDSSRRMPARAQCSPQARPLLPTTKQQHPLSRPHGLCDKSLTSTERAEIYANLCSSISVTNGILSHACNQPLQVLRTNFAKLVTAHLLGQGVRRKEGSADADANLIPYMCNCTS